MRSGPARLFAPAPIRSILTRMTPPQTKKKDRWMVAVAAIVFCVLFALLVWWMQASGVFNQAVSFRYAGLAVFLFCAAIVLVNIVGRLPMLVRWLRTKFSN